MRTFKLRVLIRWDFNFCVRISPLRGTEEEDVISKKKKKTIKKKRAHTHKTNNKTTTTTTNPNTQNKDNVRQWKRTTHLNTKSNNKVSQVN